MKIALYFLTFKETFFMNKTPDINYERIYIVLEKVKWILDRVILFLKNM